jgi:hypothetical protein
MVSIHAAAAVLFFSQSAAILCLGVALADARRIANNTCSLGGACGRNYWRTSFETLSL